jgi:hypothetical protein
MSSLHWPTSPAPFIRTRSALRPEGRKNLHDRPAANPPHVPRSTELAAIQPARDEPSRGRYPRPEPRARRRRAPYVNHASMDFQIDLVKMPDRMRLGTAQFRCNDRSEMIRPASDCFVRNCNSALGEQTLDVTKAEREPEIEPDRLVNDLRREPISRVADFRHALRLPSRRRCDDAEACVLRITSSPGWGATSSTICSPARVR